MRSENYWIDHFLEALNNTLSFFKESKRFDFVLVIAVALRETSKGIELNQIIKPCLDGVVKLIIAFGIIFLWKFISAQEHTNKKKQGIIDSLQKNIESLKKQQEAKLRIGFDPTSQKYCDKYSQVDGQTWRISVHNESAIVPIKNVTVMLTEIYEGISLLDSKEVCLKYTDHNYKPYPRHIDINAVGKEYVDVFEWIIDKENPRFDICHVEIDRNHRVSHLCYYIAEDNFRIKIEVTGAGVSPISQFFTISKRKNRDKDFIYMDVD